MRHVRRSNQNKMSSTSSTLDLFAALDRDILIGLPFVPAGHRSKFKASSLAWPSHAIAKALLSEFPGEMARLVEKAKAVNARAAQSASEGHLAQAREDAQREESRSELDDAFGLTPTFGMSFNPKTQVQRFGGKA